MYPREQLIKMSLQPLRFLPQQKKHLFCRIKTLIKQCERYRLECNIADEKCVIACYQLEIVEITQKLEKLHKILKYIDYLQSDRSIPYYLYPQPLVIF